MDRYKRTFILLISSIFLGGSHIFLITPMVAEEIPSSLKDQSQSIQTLPIENCNDSLQSSDLEQSVQNPCPSSEPVKETIPSTSDSSSVPTQIEKAPINELPTSTSLCESQINSTIEATPAMIKNLPEIMQPNANVGTQAISQSTSNIEGLDNEEAIPSEISPQDLSHTKDLSIQPQTSFVGENLLSLEMALLSVIQLHEVRQCIQSTDNPHTRQLIAPPQQKVEDIHEEKDIDQTFDRAERALEGIHPF